MKRTVTLILWGFVLLSLAVLAFKQMKQKSPQTQSSQKTDSQSAIIVTYFYNNIRCPSCKKIEALTRESLRENFTGELDSGGLLWQLVNMDEPENQHYIKDYGLHTKSVVVSTGQGNKKRWKNLDQVWNLLGNEEGFKRYIQGEVTAFMQGGKP